MKVDRPPAAFVEKLSTSEPQPFVEALYEISTDDHFWFEWRWRSTLSLLEDFNVRLDEPLRVLEVGTGVGVLRRQLEKATQWQIDSTDLDLAALAHHGERLGRTFFYDVRDRRQEFRASYDVVILFEVLEHIADPVEFLDAVFFHLADGGYFLLDVPALQMFFSAFDRAAGHYRRYDRSSLAAEFDTLPFKIEGMRYWGLLMLPLLLARNLASKFARDRDAAIRRGFKPPAPLLHGFLKKLMGVELALCRKPWCGTSLLLLGRKAQGAKLRAQRPG